MSTFSSTDQLGGQTDHVDFVGVHLVLDCRTAGWSNLASVVEQVLRSWFMARNAHARLFLSADRPAREREIAFDLGSEKDIAEIAKQVLHRDVATVHARTHRGEWESTRKGHWLWWGLGNALTRDSPNPASSFVMTLPTSKFSGDESRGVVAIRETIIGIDARVPIVYGYANRGRWNRFPRGGLDPVYAETARSIPVSNFDVPGTTEYARYRRGVKGAFWVNVLNPDHVRSLGGLEGLAARVKPHRIEQLPSGNFVVLVTPSPMVEDTPENREAFRRLFEATKPIWA